MEWKTFEEEMCCLYKKICESDYKPDIIIGIVRGGLIPARYLSTLSDVKKMDTINVSKDDDKRTVLTEFNYNLKGKEILLVEDMLESGKSLIVVKEYLESKGAIVKTACLYTMPRSEIEPDYYLKEIEYVVTFPWENILCS